MTLILLNLGSSLLNIHETSVTLLRAINKNFLQDNFESKSSTLSSTNNLDPINSFLNIDFDIINSLVIASKSQAFISEYLAKKNPEQTMFVFCEITSHLHRIIYDAQYNFNFNSKNYIDVSNLSLKSSSTDSK